jgi:hypothetical protein
MVVLISIWCLQNWKQLSTDTQATKKLFHAMRRNIMSRSQKLQTSIKEQPHIKFLRTDFCTFRELEVN